MRRRCFRAAFPPEQRAYLHSQSQQSGRSTQSLSPRVLKFSGASTTWAWPFLATLRFVLTSPGVYGLSYRIHVLPSGRHFNAESSENLIDAALRQGLVLPYGCRNGSCGRCKGRLMAGDVAWLPHRDSVVSPQERDAGVVLFCSVTPRSDLTIEAQEIRVTGDIPTRKMRVKVDVLEWLAHDVVRLYLKLPAGHRLQYLAGQYLDILLPEGKRRSFSIANSPQGGDRIELHIRNWEGGAFSGQLLGGVQEKSLLQIEAPFGEFYLREDSSHPLILVAGGTGFAPIKAIIEQALSLTAKRSMILYWGVRAVRDLYLAQLPERWLREHAHFRFVPVLSQPETTDAWSGRLGFVHQAVLADHQDFSAFDVYAAGPPAMVKATHDALIARGLPPSQFFSDPFEYARS